MLPPHNGLRGRRPNGPQLAPPTTRARGFPHVIHRTILQCGMDILVPPAAPSEHMLEVVPVAAVVPVAEAAMALEGLAVPQYWPQHTQEWSCGACSSCCTCAYGDARDHKSTSGSKWQRRWRRGFSPHGAAVGGGGAVLSCCGGRRGGLGNARGQNHFGQGLRHAVRGG